ncbi:MAG TPA: immunoglobulin domain-containing protein, partial [Jiangellaceae bacterium]
PEPSRPVPRPVPSRAAEHASEAAPEAASTMPDVGLAGVSDAVDDQSEPGRGRARVLAMAFGIAACVAASAYVAYQHADPGTTAVSETTAGAEQDPTGTAGGSGTQDVVALTVDDPAADAPDGVVAAPPGDAQQESDGPATSTDDDATSTSPDAPPSPSDSPSPTEPSTSPSPTPLVSEEPGTAPLIEVHPGNVSAEPGQSATLSVRATGAPQPAIQWQERAPGGSGWADIAGGVAEELTVQVADAGFDGRAYRVMVTNDLGAVASEAAVLTVEFAPQITAQPVDARVDAGGEVFLEASASAKPGMTDVRWQVRRPGDGSWHDVPASFPAGTLTRLKLSDVDAAMDGYDYRAVFANAHGEAATDPATISVDTADGS